MSIVELVENIARQRFAADSRGNAFRVSDLCNAASLSTLVFSPLFEDLIRCEKSLMNNFRSFDQRQFCPCARVFAGVWDIIIR